MCRCCKKATGGSSFCSFASTRLTDADLEPEADGEAGTPKTKIKLNKKISLFSSREIGHFPKYIIFALKKYLF